MVDTGWEKVKGVRLVRESGMADSFRFAPTRIRRQLRYLIARQSKPPAYSYLFLPQVLSARRDVLLLETWRCNFILTESAQIEFAAFERAKSRRGYLRAGLALPIRRSTVVVCPSARPISGKMLCQWGALNEVRLVVYLLEYGMVVKRNGGPEFLSLFWTCGRVFSLRMAAT